MIILSGALVVLAIALLVTGIVTGNTGHEVLGLDGLKLIYISIGVSIVSALCLAIGVFLRRKELFGSAESPASAKRSAASRSAKAARTAKAKARVGAGDDAPVTVTPATAAEVPAGTSVYIVPGRKRYHLETCRQLAGRKKEELTFVEAREEGFTACTACLPDTALAARAALTETEAAPTETLDTAESTATDITDITDTVGTVGVDLDPVDVTRTDLPITRVDTDTAPDLTGTDLADEHPAGHPAVADVTDEGAGHETPSVFAESPAPAEPTETEPTEAREAKDETPAADTAHLDEVSDAETASEPAAEERLLARSRSLFEPLDRGETSAAEAEETQAADDAPAAAEEHAAGEDTAVASHTAEEPADEDATEDDAVAEADTADASDTAEDDEPATAVAAVATEDDAGKPAAEEDAAPAGDAEDATTAEDTADDATEGDDAADSDLPYVRILSGTKRYHRPDCALIEDIAEDADDLETLSPAEAKERGCTPCLVCQPDKSPSDRF